MDRRRAFGNCKSCMRAAVTEFTTAAAAAAAPIAAAAAAAIAAAAAAHILGRKAWIYLAAQSEFNIPRLNGKIPFALGKFVF